MNITFIGISELDKYFNNPNVEFIDLRDTNDYRKQHIKGATSMPYDIFKNSYKKLPKNKKYVLYCERGATSIIAASLMLKAGYTCYSLAGGIEAFYDWKMFIKKFHINDN